jgi:hypothetical protein
MNRNMLRAAVCALSFVAAGAAGAAEATAPTMPLALARDVTTRAIELVESKGMYPLQQGDYAQAKQRLLALVDGKAQEVDRSDLYARINGLLATLDTDKHSFAMPPVAPGQFAGAAPAGPRVPMFQLVATTRGTVLRFVPPPITTSTSEAMSAYVQGVYDEAGALPGIRAACALVVDLSEQTGGNGWPPLIAMYPLFGDANRARWVERDGNAVPVVHRGYLESKAGRDAPGHVNPFASFATEPLAVLVGAKTASAGEMLLVALMGEARVRTFGQTSYGMSTANMTYTLPDGALFVLTQARSALADGPVFRGGIAPMQPAPKGEPVEASLKTAAEWAAASSPRCTSR